MSGATSAKRGRPIPRSREKQVRRRGTGGLEDHNPPGMLDTNIQAGGGRKLGASEDFLWKKLSGHVHRRRKDEEGMLLKHSWKGK